MSMARSSTTSSGEKGHHCSSSLARRVTPRSISELWNGFDDDFTVLSYDRRAYSRSPRPAGYTGSTVDVEADDAAALLRALDLAPALGWGNSSGDIIGLSLVLRYPEVVRKAMLHEPPPFAGLSDTDHVMDFLK